MKDNIHENMPLLPVTIVTGFLGSGKTTLLNHILSHQHGVRTAVLINEFGEIGIDQELIVSQEDGIIELSNGCICCTINEDLLEAVAGILDRRDSIDYLIVETTGIADPYAIALTFVGKHLSPYIRLDSILTLVDAENLSDDILQEPSAYNQIKYSDIVLLNKCDLVNEDQIKDQESRIRNIKPESRILRTNRAEIALPLILGIEAFSSDLLGDRPSSHHESNSFTSLSFEFDYPFVLVKLRDFLSNELPLTVYRAKGILWIEGSEECYVFHMTGRRFTIEPGLWRSSKRKNQLVFIGSNLDKEMIKNGLTECLLKKELV